MTGNQNVSTGEAREKLKNLRSYMPNQDESIYSLCEFLADRLEKYGDLTPQIFRTIVSQACHDLEHGTDNFTKQPIKNKIAMRSTAFYEVLDSYIPDVAAAIFPEDFATDVSTIYAGVKC